MINHIFIIIKKNQIVKLVVPSNILIVYFKKPPSKDGGVEFFQLKSTKEIDTGFFLSHLKMWVLTNLVTIKAYIRYFVNSSELNIPTELITIIENYYYPTFYHRITDLDNGKLENYKCKKQIISILYSYKDCFFNNYIITMKIGTKIRNKEILEITNLNEYCFQYINDDPKFSSPLRKYYEISSLSFIRK